MLPKQHRLRRSKDFAKVYRYGKKAVSAHLVLRTLTLAKPQNDGAEAVSEPLAALPPSTPLKGAAVQIGIVVSQKVSKRAVVRNRLKRQIRSAMNHLLPGLRPDSWVVINVRPGADECEYGEFLRELEQLLTKLEVIHGS
ncbi:MAG: ribonuclease P protein component [Oscillatoriales cyanobacterium SM2_2_1]|nr:ribonuclease P protein component [Oscillatoriales cyanobacterium SM2_2_1]